MKSLLKQFRLESTFPNYAKIGNRPPLHTPPAISSLMSKKKTEDTLCTIKKLSASIELI
jgi:hypothetical protein